MELQKLHYFYTAAQLQHMTRAAEHLYISQPSLTQAIKSLEEELGVPLFEKKGRNIVLTAYGEYLRKRLDRILPELDDLPQELAQMKERVNKTVKLNILAASTFVINAIVGYRRRNPDVIFDLEQNEQKQNCDILITTNGSRAFSERQYSQRCVKEERIYLAVPKTSIFANYDAIDLSLVREEGFVMLSSSRLFGVICNQFCAAVGFIPKILFESDSPGAVQSIIGTGTGIAFWPEYSWGKARDCNVALLPISNPICQRELILELYDHQSTSEYAADFYRYLLAQF